MVLLDLPSEILAHIFANLRFFDLLSVLATCRAVREFSEDELLWREVFLKEFDDPRARIATLTETPRKRYYAKHDNFKWSIELKQRILALSCLRDRDAAYQNCCGDAYETFVETLLDMIDTASASPEAAPKKEKNVSLNIDLLPLNDRLDQEFDALLRGTLQPKTPLFTDNVSGSATVGVVSTIHANSWLWEPSPGRPMTRARAALEADKIQRSENASRLHVLRGLTEHEEEDEKAAGRARRICYDWSLTNERNEFGLWKDDGSGATDWRRIEAVASVVTRQFVHHVRGRITLPQGFAYSLPYRILSDPTVSEDWAGLQRRWISTYVFIHWESLVEFNEFRDTGHRPSLEYMPEACGGLMKVSLKLDMDLKDDPTLKSTLPFCDDLPPLFFSGVSRSEDWQMVTGIRGMCCLAPGGREVRWRYIVHYGGSDQWQLEGVQPGGPRSGCIYGTWTSVLHEEGGPVGPFCYVAEEMCKME